MEHHARCRTYLSDDVRPVSLVHLRFYHDHLPALDGGKEIPLQQYVTAFVLLLLGNVLFYIGLATQHSLLSLAVISTLAGWAVAVYALLRVVLDTPPSDKLNPVVILLTLALGWLDWPRI